MILFPNTNITIYNKYFDKVSGSNKYQRTVLRNVDWQGKRNATVGDKGLNLDDSIMIFVDKFDNYISPKRFNLLSDEERFKYFTFGISDIIVKGEIDFEITGVKPNNIADVERNFDDVVTILSVQEWSTHWQVEAK